MTLASYLGVSWLLYWRWAELNGERNLLSQLGVWFGLCALWIEACKALLQL